ncbi:MAG: fructose-1,6-bisphosphatase [Firmicutes bacterium]|nr:fructose-1,6-bisphosphatase [Bacillota bacterium]
MIIENNESKYLKLLAKDFPSVEDAQAEIINLMAILNLPKGTEHFLSDIHGEYEAFNHILQNASGTIKIRIDEVFPELMPSERRTLATLVYYPEEKLEILKKETEDLHGLYSSILYRLIRLLKRVSFKYTRSFVRKEMPPEYAYIIEELLYGSEEEALGRAHHKQDIIESIIEIGASDDFIKDMCNMISRLAVYRLHVVGDLFDRGSGSDKVIDLLKKQNRVDIQWGNHDILWMGAAAGNRSCIANVIRICTRYDNLHTLEVGYGISLRPLVTFALTTYKDDPCTGFKAAVTKKDAMYDTDLDTLRKIGKAIAVMQFKVEGQLIDEHPYYECESLKLLDKIDFENKTVNIDGKDYPMSTCNFPTVDPKDPYKLTPEEDAVMSRLQDAFMESELLQDHVRYLFANGSIYKVFNGNLLFHGAVPMTKSGEFDPVQTPDGPLAGKKWFDYADTMVRAGYFGSADPDKRKRGVDLFWYLWCGYKSPLFGKKRITTFERLFVEDESTWKEAKNPYYNHIDDEEKVEMILAEFGANVESGCIINGHIPVKKGSKAVHANGRCIVIDGGFAKPYQKTTGIAGYCLVQNSYGFILSANEPFESKEQAILKELDIHSTSVATESSSKRILNRDTDQGKEIAERIEALKNLLVAYREGIIQQGR